MLGIWEKYRAVINRNKVRTDIAVLPVMNKQRSNNNNNNNNNLHGNKQKLSKLENGIGNNLDIIV